MSRRRRNPFMVLLLGLITGCHSESLRVKSLPDEGTREPASIASPTLPSRHNYERLGYREAVSGEPSEADSEGAQVSPDDEPDDDVESAENDDGKDSIIVTRRTSANHPLAALTQSELERRVKEVPQSLGSVSLGRPNAGTLFNAVKMPDDPAWKLVDPGHAYGTEETVDAMSRALHEVRERFPDTEPVAIGHLSAKNGGPLSPHRSHQSGRDVDVGFYYVEGKNPWYARATAENLDLKRTIYLIRALVEDGYIEMVLIDQSLHEPLRECAIAEGWDSEFVEGLFRSKGGRFAIVRHAPGHATHLHLRFRNPMAQRSGELLAGLLTKHRVAVVPPKTITHVARSGDTLAKLAARYGASMHQIRVQNGMRNTQLVAGHSYQIPVSVTGSPAPAQVGRSAARAVSPTVRK